MPMRHRTVNPPQKDEDVHAVSPPRYSVETVLVVSMV